MFDIVTVSFLLIGFLIALGHGTSTSRQTLTSSLQSSWLMRRGNGDARSSSSGADMNHHHHLGLGVIGGGRGVGGGPGKGCATPQCSWRLLAIALLLTCGLLAAALAYFTGKNNQDMNVC